MTTTDRAADLTGKQRRYLRGLGTQLKPTVYMGKEGISSALLESFPAAFTNSELVVVKVGQACPIHRKQAGLQLAEATNSHLVQILGRTILLYRRDPETPTIELP